MVCFESVWARRLLLWYILIFSLVILAIAWHTFMSCTLILVGSVEDSWKDLKGFGLWNKAVYDEQNGKMLGCVRYSEYWSSELRDRAFVTSRVFGIVLAATVTAATVLCMIVQCFTKHGKSKMWNWMRWCYYTSFVCQGLIFYVFGSDLCKEHRCAFGPSGGVAIANMVFLFGMMICVFNSYPPRNPVFRLWNASDEQKGSDFPDFLWDTDDQSSMDIERPNWREEADSKTPGDESRSRVRSSNDSVSLFSGSGKSSLRRGAATPSVTSRSRVSFLDKGNETKGKEDNGNRPEEERSQKSSGRGGSLASSKRMSSNEDPQTEEVPRKDGSRYGVPPEDNKQSSVASSKRMSSNEDPQTEEVSQKDGSRYGVPPADSKQSLEEGSRKEDGSRYGVPSEHELEPERDGNIEQAENEENIDEAENADQIDEGSRTGFRSLKSLLSSSSSKAKESEKEKANGSTQDDPSHASTKASEGSRSRFLRSLISSSSTNVKTSQKDNESLQEESSPESTKASASQTSKRSKDKKGATKDVPDAQKSSKKDSSSRRSRRSRSSSSKRSSSKSARRTLSPVHERSEKSGARASSSKASSSKQSSSKGAQSHSAVASSNGSRKSSIESVPSKKSGRSSRKDTTSTGWSEVSQSVIEPSGRNYGSARNFEEFSQDDTEESFLARLGRSAKLMPGGIRVSETQIGDRIQIVDEYPPGSEDGQIYPSDMVKVRTEFCPVGKKTIKEEMRFDGSKIVTTTIDPITINDEVEIDIDGSTSMISYGSESPNFRESVNR